MFGFPSCWKQRFSLWHFSPALFCTRGDRATVACKCAEQEPHHKQKHTGASIGKAQDQNINHKSCLGKNSFWLVMAYNKVSCLAFWHAWCHRLPRNLISFRCLLLNELIFSGTAIYWFIAGLHLYHMIFSHSSSWNRKLSVSGNSNQNQLLVQPALGIRDSLIQQ